MRHGDGRGALSNPNSRRGCQGLEFTLRGAQLGIYIIIECGEEEDEEEGSGGERG